jgi:aryl-alcohol dehydrogenase-like predicted oxidoreductase
MFYRDFGKLGWKVSAIGMGTWNIGNQWGQIDDLTAIATVRAALDCGVNLFDTAEAYGMPFGLSELRLGVALSGMRQNVHIVSKIGHWGQRTGHMVPKTHPDLVRLCAHAILYRLRTDCVDVMLCHERDPQNPDVYLDAFEELKKDGRIRAYGISTDSLEALKRFNARGACDVAEINYSLLNRSAERELLPYCRDNGIATLIRGPLAMGMLSGKYSADSVFTDTVRASWSTKEGPRARFLRQAARVEQLRKALAPGEEMITAALRFVISHPACPVAIPGAKSPEQAVMNARAGDRTLTSQETAQLTALAE